MLKKLIAVVIILGSTVIGVFLIGQSAIQNKDKISLKDDSASNSALAEQVLKVSSPVEELKSLTRENSESVKDALGQKKETPTEPNQSVGKNSTEEIAQRIIQGITKDNPQGLSLLDGGRLNLEELKNFDPLKYMDQFLVEASSDFDYSNLKPKIKTSELKTISFADKKAIETYLQDFQKAIKEDVSAFTANSGNLSVRDFKNIESELEKIISRLYELPVPKDLIELHAEEIALLSAQKNIFGALTNMSNDPLKSLFALNAFQPINEELTELKNKFINFMAKNNLTI